MAIVVTVLPEDTRVAFADANPVAVNVDEPGGDRGPFSVMVALSEKEPDEPAGSSAPGDISLAHVSMSLVPVGPGGFVDGTCTPGAVMGSGYDAELPVTCEFDDVPVNTQRTDGLGLFQRQVHLPGAWLVRTGGQPRVQGVRRGLG